MKKFLFISCFVLFESNQKKQYFDFALFKSCTFPYKKVQLLKKLRQNLKFLYTTIIFLAIFCTFSYKKSTAFLIEPLGIKKLTWKVFSPFIWSHSLFSPQGKKKWEKDKAKLCLSSL
jgi:hypothetical protein